MEKTTEHPTVSTKVLILTHHYRIRGAIALAPGVRLTDFLVQSKSFVAVTDATVTDLEGREILTTAFMDVNRDQIQVITPAEFVCESVPSAG
jgi:hypothetical protein